MAIQRLPSGIYFNMIAASTSREKDYMPEYPTFPVRLKTSGIAGSNHTVQHRNVAGPDQPLRDPPPRPARPELCLPLLSISVDMHVDCNIAKTNLVQTFANHGDESIPEAWYSFPLYDGAAVTSFRCEVGDDKVLEGKVKPKAEAKREYERAIKKQEAAALLEEMAPDVFQTTIGNIKPKTTVKVEITYVEELHTDLGGDGIVVTIPTSVAPRYGTPPAGYATNSSVEATELEIDVDIAYPDPIGEGDIICRSGHETYIKYGELKHPTEFASFEALAELQSQGKSEHNPNHATAKFVGSETALDADFVLFIRPSDKAFLQSRALFAPSNGPDHAAMMVTVRPSELFSDLRESMNEFQGEILFLADRSGSMRGPKIETLKDALLVFLKSLPARCKFNLYSFGSTVSGLWPCSMPYDDSTVQDALDHVSTFEANYRGTEVLKALKKAVGDRRSTDACSTQVILLTDGEIWKSQETIEFVRTTTADSESQVRFFSLGIGNQVNHHLIQGIGFFGAGFGETVAVDAQGNWKEAVIRMLKGAVMPKSWSYTINLGDEWTENQFGVDEFLPHQSEENDHWARGRISGPVTSCFIQAPREIPWLHHFGHQTVYFLLDTTVDRLPDHVTVTASSQYGGSKTATLAVTKATTNSNTIQHLAAKAAVRDAETQHVSETTSSNQIRKHAEQLCQMYSISSKWTSFVAISHSQQSAEYEDVDVSLYKAPLSELDLLARPGISQAGANLASGALAVRSPFGGPSAVPSAVKVRDKSSYQGFEWNPQMSYRRSGGPHTYRKKAIASRLFDDAAVDSPPTIDNCASSTGFSSSESTTSPWTAAAELELNHEFQDQLKSNRPRGGRAAPPGTTQQAFNLADNSRRDGIVSDHNDHGFDGPIIRAQALSPFDGPSPLDWLEFIPGQRADGLFRLNQSLGDSVAQHFCHGTWQALSRWLVKRLKTPVTDDADGSEKLKLFVDTVMALAYIRSHFYSERQMWDLLVQKAEGTLASELNSLGLDTPDGLTAMAGSALAHAHYGRCSQGTHDDDSGQKDSPSRSRSGCGVCDAQDDASLTSGSQGDGSLQCSDSGCNSSMDKWDEFWAHVVEQGHINSSCGTARSRWIEAEAKANGPPWTRGLQEATAEPPISFKCNLNWDYEWE